METERKYRKSMRISCGCCVKLREKIQAICNCLVDEGKLIKRRKHGRRVQEMTQCLKHELTMLNINSRFLCII